MVFFDVNSLCMHCIHQHFGMAPPDGSSYWRLSLLLLPLLLPRFHLFAFLRNQSTSLLHRMLCRCTNFTHPVQCDTLFILSNSHFDKLKVIFRQNCPPHRPHTHTHQITWFQFSNRNFTFCLIIHRLIEWTKKHFILVQLQSSTHLVIG